MTAIFHESKHIIEMYPKTYSVITTALTKTGLLQCCRKQTWLL